MGLYRFDFHYYYHYLNPSFSQSDELGLPNWPIRLLKTQDKVAVVIAEVESEPLYYKQEDDFLQGSSWYQPIFHSDTKLMLHDI